MRLRLIAWLGGSFLAVIGIGLGELYLADRLTDAVSLADTEREIVVGLQALLLGAALVPAVLVIGRGLGLAGRQAVGLEPVLVAGAAALAAYLLIADMRSGHFFETDHALPELFVGMAVVLVGAARAAVRVAEPTARAAWTVATALAAVLLLAVVLGTARKAILGEGGMWPLDEPTTAVVLAACAAYGLLAATAGARFLAERRPLKGMRPGSDQPPAG